MSFKGKETFTSLGSRRSYSSFGNAASSRFSPGTWILRGLAIVSLLATVRRGAPHRTPSFCSGPLSQTESCRHVGNRTDTFCLPADKWVKWSAGRQTVHPTDGRYRSQRSEIRDQRSEGGCFSDF